MNLNLPNKTQGGFTLLEVMISMAILVFISFAIYQATVETFKLRESLSTEGNFHNSIRLATSIIQRDISLIYSPIVTLPSPSPSWTSTSSGVSSNTAGSDDSNVSTNFWAKPVNETGLRPSRLIGTSTQLSFISVSHQRIYKDSGESDFAKITYELKKENRDADHPDASILVKSESPNAFSKDDLRDNFKKTYELLHGVKSLKFSYLQRDGNTWKTQSSWDSDKEETKNTFPDIIELNMEVLGPKNQSFDGIFKFKPEIPLNGINPHF